MIAHILFLLLFFVPYFKFRFQKGYLFECQFLFYFYKSKLPAFSLKLTYHSFIPVVIGPFGEIGDVFMRFWDGSVKPTLLVFPKEYALTPPKLPSELCPLTPPGICSARQTIVGEKRKEKHNLTAVISHHYRVFGRTNRWGWFTAPSWRITSTHPSTTSATTPAVVRRCCLMTTMQVWMT